MNPHFEYKRGFLPKSLCQEWIHALGKQNAERIAMSVANVETQTHDLDFLSPDVVSYLFTVCIRLRLPSEVRYLAAQIFQKYMSRQLYQLLHFFRNMHEDKVLPSKEVLYAEWGKVETNMSRQLPLRILTVIQIASKVCSYHDSLSTKQTSAALRALGYAYTEKALLKSEIRILRTISFHIPDSPLTYVDTIINTFSNDEKMRNEMQTLWQHCLLYLDIFLLHQREVIITLYRKVAVNDTLVPPEQIRIETEKYVVRTRNNFLLVASGVVCAALQTVCFYDVSQWASLEIVSRFAISKVDMANFAHTLLNLVVRQAEHHRQTQTQVQIVQEQGRTTQAQTQSIFGRQDGGVSRRKMPQATPSRQPPAKIARRKP